ncbi:MAG TPA: hypothetical protein VEY91_11395, partial [Candidatus Limnocylindria bacterium]|nr:hypothetical protein [Candidatus Limnocylindria bacterium]
VVPDVERVRASEAFAAERYLRVGHRPEAPRIGYYFASPAGKRWAQRTATTLQQLGLPPPPLAAEAQYPLQQTSCPALYVSLARVDSAAHEQRMHAPGALRAEAYGLFIALAREFDDPPEWPIDSLDVRDANARPAPGTPVTLGGTLVLESDALGRIRFARSEPGPLEARLARPGSRRVLLDSDRGVILTERHGP